MLIELNSPDELKNVLDNSVELIIGFMKEPLSTSVWEHLNRIVKPRGVIAVIAHEPLDFIASHRKGFRHSWGNGLRCSVWAKGNPRYNHTSTNVSKQYPIAVPKCETDWESYIAMVELCTNPGDCALQFNCNWGPVSDIGRSLIAVNEL